TRRRTRPRGGPRPRRPSGQGRGPGIRSQCPQREYGGPRASEETVLRLLGVEPNRTAEEGAREHRHGKRLSLGEDPVHVVEINRHRLEAGPGATEVVETALERPELAAGAPGPLGKADERIAFAHLRRQRLDRPAGGGRP